MNEGHYEVRARNKSDREIVIGFIDGDPEFNPLVSFILQHPEKYHSPRVVDVYAMLDRQREIS